MFDRLFSEAAGSPAWTLFVETSLKGTWLLILAALVVLTLRRASAAHRHLVWACALAGLVTLPVLLALLPAWRVSAPALAWLAPAPYRDSSPGSDNLASSVIKDAPAGSPKAAAQKAADPAPASPSHGIAVPTVAEPVPALVGRADFSWPTIAIAAWLIGAIVVLLTFLAGHVVMRVLVRARPVRDGEWHALALEVADQLRLTVPFALLRADKVIVPVAFGLFRPRVLLPVACDTWPLDLRRAVLLHELAHVQRHDCLTQAVAQVACALFWFHPGVWWASSRLQIEREHACDDRVLEARTRPSDYADHLLDFVRSLRASRGAALGAVTFARRSTLEGRLLAVLDPLRNRSAVGSRVAAPAVLVAALLVLPFAAFEPVTAGSMHAREKAVTDTKALRPSRVVPVPEGGSLAQRVAWTRTEASRSHEPAYWIGWLIETMPSEGNMLSDSHGISVDVLSRRGAFTLDDVLAGRDHGTNDAGERHGTTSPAPKTAAVLVRISGDATDRVRVQTPSLPAEFSGEPLYWLDAVSEDQSFAWLRDAAGRERNDHLRGQLVESVSFMRNHELVTPYLVGMFRSAGSAHVRASAAEGLARHPSSETVALLADGARSDRSPQVRRACVEALGQVQTPMALEALMAIARRSEGDERRAAFDALGDHVSRDAPDDREAESKARDAEAEAERARERMEDQLGALDRSGQDGVDDEGSQPMAQEDLEVQRQAIESLGRYPESQSLQQLRRIAQTSPNSDLRAQAVESIGRLATPAALAVVEEIVWKNRHEQARAAAVEALGRRFESARTVDKLFTIGHTHPSRDTRRTAVEALGRLDGKDARDALDRIITAGDDPEIQRQAVESLGRRNDEDVERRLTEIARAHRSIEVRRQAVESLGRREGPRTVERMMELARADGPQEVQRQAAESLGRIDDARVKGMLLDLAQNHPSIEVEEQAVESLGRLEIDVMSDLARIARTHRSSRVRRQAVESMTRRDPDQALPLLEEMLRQPKRKTGT